MTLCLPLYKIFKIILEKQIDSIIQAALKTIHVEQETVKLCADCIDDNFVAIVKLIQDTSGKVVITGIGKSAIVSQKIVATFNSTGTPSLFMHAADALHGDLGMISENDIVICISKSGNSQEFKTILPLLKNNHTSTIAITNDKESYLARHADFKICPILKSEAEPNNLAPTASFISHLVIGDALAASLIHNKGFTESDFAKVHPAGTLGKQLLLKVQDILHNDSKPLVKPSATIRETILEISSKRLGATAVCGVDQKLLGIITDGDLRRMLQQEKDTKHLLARDIMSKDPQSVDQNTLASEALSILRSSKINNLIITQNGQYIAMLHLHDILREGIV